MNEDNNLINPETVNYDEGNIQTLTGLEHIRLRPGMYIGRLGDGSSAEGCQRPAVLRPHPTLPEIRL